MPSGRIIFACSFVASAAIHAVLWWKLPRYYGHPGSPKPKAPIATVTILPVPPKPPQNLFGESKGSGAALNASAGDKPQSSPKPLVDQSAFTRDPAGQSSSAAPPKPKPLAQAVTTPPPAALPTPPLSPFPSFRKPDPPTPPAPQPSSKPPQPEVATKPPSPAGGTPLPHSDKDSDPFAKQWSAEFRGGEVVARTGRQQKLMRPKINLGAIVQAAEIRFPCTTKFRIRIDNAGRVRNATIVSSSGSSSIDRAFLLSVYESWFEPAKDDAGRPVGDEFEFGWTIPR